MQKYHRIIICSHSGNLSFISCKFFVLAPHFNIVKVCTLVANSLLPPKLILISDNGSTNGIDDNFAADHFITDVLSPS